MTLGQSYFLTSLPHAALFASAALSGARTLAGSEADALALDFTDNSAYVIDTTTPANNYDSTASGLLTYTSPSAKIIRVSGGLLASASTIRTEYDSDGTTPLGVRVEEARTELCLWNSDLTNAAWTASNITPVKTATGPDGVANSATTLTATAGNGTVLQSITSGSAARITSCWIKRRTGSGTINLTMDNGGTWTAVTVTSSWTMVEVPSATAANPVVGLRIVTSGDAVDVANFSNQVGAFVTSPIATTSATVARAADNISLATSAFPNDSNGPITWFAKVYNVLGSRIVGMEVSEGPLMRNNNTQVLAYQDPDAFVAIAGSGGFAGSVAKVAFSTDGTTGYLCFNAGSVGSSSFPYSMVGPTMRLGSEGGTSNFMNGHFQQLLMIPRQESGAELQTRTTL